MRVFGIVLVLGLLLLPNGAFGESKAEKNLSKLSDNILDNLQEYWPVHATEMGVHKYDDRFTDYSTKAVKSQKRKLRDFLATLHKYNRSNLSVDSRINHKLLVSNCEAGNLRLWGIRYHESNPNLYIDEAVNGIYNLLISNYAPLDTRVDRIIARMRAVPKLFRQAQNNLKSVPPIWLEYAKENSENAITFYRTVQEGLSKELPTRQGELRLASDEAIDALIEFKNYLDGVTPGAVGSFAIGADHFNHLLSSEHLLDYDADALLKIGETWVKKTQDDRARIKLELDESVGNDEVDFFVPASFSKQDVLDYYIWELDAVKHFITAKELLTLPENIGECIPTETPVFLRGVISSIAYQPAGPLDSDNTGYFYVRPIPEEIPAEDRQAYYAKAYKRSFRGSVVHEAFPGHHLQMQIAGNHESELRQWQMNNMLIEGWALYCEEMMAEQGLYPDNPKQQLKVLRGVLFRAIRIVVDVKLHTGQFSFDQAVDYMMTEMNLEEEYRDFANKEVLRYTMDPTQPMSYLVGKLEILKLKSEVEVRQGKTFSLKSFHDKLLAEGSIPPSLIRRKMQE